MAKAQISFPDGTTVRLEGTPDEINAVVGGNTFEGEATLVAVGGARPPRRTSDRQPRAPARTSPDLSLPVRAFVKRHAKGRGGPQKFTVLLARLTGGKVGAAVGLKEI